MTKIKIIENGPALIIQDTKEFPDLDLLEPNGKTHQSRNFAICRCGLSFNGILCDGSHVNKKKDGDV